MSGPYITFTHTLGERSRYHIEPPSELVHLAFPRGHLGAQLSPCRNPLKQRIGP